MRDERRHSACPHVDLHRQALGYLAPWTYINRKVSLPGLVVDLALVSSYSGVGSPLRVLNLCTSDAKLAPQVAR